MGFSLVADNEVRTITELPPRWFVDRDIRLVLLDFDNTVVPYTTSVPTDTFLKWKQAMEAAGRKIMVVSNSRKSRRVPDFCEKWNIPWIRHAGKPNPKGIRMAMEQMGEEPAHTAMVGDQTFTDILGGNLAGVTSILVYPLHFSNPFQRIRYGIERPLIAMGRNKRKR